MTTDLDPDPAESSLDDLVWRASPNLPPDAYRAISEATRRAQDAAYRGGTR